MTDKITTMSTRMKQLHIAAWLSRRLQNPQERSQSPNLHVPLDGSLQVMVARFKNPQAWSSWRNLIHQYILQGNSYLPEESYLRNWYNSETKFAPSSDTNWYNSETDITQMHIMTKKLKQKQVHNHDTETSSDTKTSNKRCQTKIKSSLIRRK